MLDRLWLLQCESLCLSTKQCACGANPHPPTGATPQPGAHPCPCRPSAGEPMLPIQAGPVAAGVKQETQCPTANGAFCMRCAGKQDALLDPTPLPPVPPAHYAGCAPRSAWPHARSMSVRSRQVCSQPLRVY